MKNNQRLLLSCSAPACGALGMTMLMFSSASLPAETAAERIGRGSQEYVREMDAFMQARAAQIEEFKKRDAETLAALDGCESVLPKDRQPGIVSTTPLEYPEQAKKSNQRGQVGVCVRVMADGSTRPMGIIQSSWFPSLDEAALNGVQSWTFLVAKDEQGRPIDDYRKVRINFSLTD